MAASLFAGAGGDACALMQAANARGLNVNLIAVNHWETAVKTHTLNYPGHVHFCEDIETVDPLKAVPGGKLHVLTAGPSCTHYSWARGGVPMDEQQRMTPWQVFKWCERLDVENVLIENVPAFETWGPLGDNGRPLRKGHGLGSEFGRYIGAFIKLGYYVDWQILCAAHYGDPTMRRRLFLQARRQRITWPAPTHYAPEVAALNDCPAWRTTRDIIDWSLPSQSIFHRPRPLAEATMNRIMAGIRKFWGEPFLMGVGGPRSLYQPIPLTEPLRTILSQNHLALIQPYLIHFKGTSDAALARSARPLDTPIPGLCAQGEHVGLVEPFLICYHGGPQGMDRGASVNTPLGTVDGSNRYGLVQPFLVSYYGNGDAHSIEEPMPTATGHDRFGLVEGIPDGAALDIHLRMLQPHELAAAHSFPSDYQFAGNRGDQVKQVGNSWPVRMGAAILGEVLGGIA